jgi:adenine-specific DNA-methyltransferase
MMYSRLYLAKNLLCASGAIFVSVNDIEAPHLRRLMDEILGEENFVAQVVWQRSKRGDTKTISNNHEYVIVYAKDKTETIEKCRWKRPKEGADAVLAHYKQLREDLNDNHAAIRDAMMAWYRSMPQTDARKAHRHYSWSDQRGLYFAADFAGPDDGRKNRPRHDILHPVTGKSCRKPSTGWRWDEDKTKWALAQDPPRVHFGPDETTIPTRKTYLHEIDAETFPSVFYADGRSATLEVEALVGAGVFPFPKNVEIIEDFISLICEDGDIVVDFFAGSGTTGHAVFNQRAKGRELSFILVQLPEECEPGSPAAEAGYKTIAAIALARLRKAQSNIIEADVSPRCDKPKLGFKTFALGASCFRQWASGDPTDNDESLLDRLEHHVDHLASAASPPEVLFELLLKDGFPLTVSLERLALAGKEVFSTAEGALLVCLDKQLTQEVIDAMAELEPSRVICLDAGFQGNDQLKANAMQTFKARARNRETAIEFRTV